MTEEEVVQKARNKIEERNKIGARLGFEDGYVIGYFDAIAENSVQWHYPSKGEYPKEPK